MGSENISGAMKYFSGSIQMFTDYFPTWTAIGINNPCGIRKMSKTRFRMFLDVSRFLDT